MKTKYYNIQNAASHEDSFSSTSRILLKLLDNTRERNSVLVVMQLFKII